MGMPGRTGDHEWSQRHLSHYVEGDLRPAGEYRARVFATGSDISGRVEASMITAPVYFKLEAQGYEQIIKDAA